MTRYTMRMGIPVPDEAKGNDFPVDLGAAMDAVDAAAVQALTSTWAGRPAFGTPNRLLFISDWATAHPSSPFQWDTGSAWVDVDPRPQLNQAFFVAGGFVVGPRPARWIAPAACVLTYGKARLDGGSSGTTVKWGIYVNGSQAPTGGTSNLSGSVTQGAGVSAYDFVDVPIAEGDSVQLYVGAVAGVAADLSVTLGGHWTAVEHA